MAEPVSMTALSQNAARRLGSKLYFLLTPVALVLVLGGFSLAEPRIVSGANLVNILTQASYLVVFATAQVVVILTRGFDLSLGMAVSSISVLSALVMTGGVGGGVYGVVALAILASLAFALAVGLFHGFCITRLHVNPFIATLGGMNICYGFASMISGGRPVFGVPAEFSNLVYNGSVMGIPAPLVLAAVVLGAVHMLLTRTVAGRCLYLIGANPRASEVAGIATKRYLVLAYVLCATLAAIGALMLTGRTGSGEPNLGGNLTLESIAAAVIGGASLRGGVGGISSAVLGALFVTVLSNGMNLTRVDGYVQMIVLGVVIILALAIDQTRNTRGGV